MNSILISTVALILLFSILLRGRARRLHRLPRPLDRGGRPEPPLGPPYTYIYIYMYKDIYIYIEIDK